MDFFKSTIISLFICISLLSCVHHTLKRNDLFNENLKDKVKSVSESTFDAIEKFGEAQKSTFNSKLISNYNKDAQISQAN